MPPISESKKLTLTTDYPYDKVVFKRSGTISVPKASSIADAVTVTIPHGLPFTPLCVGSYSNDSWATSFDFGSGSIQFVAAFNQFMNSPFGVVESDATNIYATFINFAATTTFAYRVTALQPISIPSNTSIAESPVTYGLYMDSTENYLKIYDQGTISVNDSGSAGFDVRSVTHNLGYIPVVLIFSTWDGRTRLYGSEQAIGVSGVEAYSTLTTTTLNMYFDTYFAGLFTMHYRIYLDD